MLSLVLRELRWLSRRATEGSKDGPGVLLVMGAHWRQAVMMTEKTVTVMARTGTGRDNSRQHRMIQGKTEI